MPPRHSRPAAGRALRAAAVPVGLVLAAGMVWQSSYAAFTATTVNPGNSWQAGTVSISDSQGGNSLTPANVGTALFSTANASGQDLEPGEPSERCITVTYTGNSKVNIVIYASATGALAPYLRTRVEVSTNSATADCTGFEANGVTPVVSQAGSTNAQTLAHYATTHSGYASGSAAWEASTSGEYRTYRITTTVVGNNAAQGTTATAAFTWEAQTPKS